MMEDVVRVFLCEDDENLGPLLSEFLNTKGYQTDLFQDGQAGWEAFEQQPDHWNICVLDVMMPKMDGFELAQKIKSKNESLPIIFLTAKTLSEDVEQGFKLGADDYLKKPFNTAELTMRIDAVLRRVQGKKPEPVAFYNIGDFVFDTQKQMLTFRDEEPKRLTTKETDLLTLLCIPGDRSSTVVGVGDYLTELLTQQYGYNVIHDTGEYDTIRDKAYSKAAPALFQRQHGARHEHATHSLREGGAKVWDNDLLALLPGVMDEIHGRGLQPGERQIERIAAQVRPGHGIARRVSALRRHQTRFTGYSPE